MGIQSDAFLNGEGDAWYRRNKAKQRIDEVIPLLSKNLIAPYGILEIGCGDGRRLFALERHYPRALLSGVDVSLDAIQVAVNRQTAANGKIRFQKGEATKWIGKKAEFDLVICGFFLYVCDREDLFRIVNNIDHVLCDGGHLIIHDFDPDGPHKVPYVHKDGLFSYKMDYADLWLANPAYKFVDATYPTPETSVVLLKKDIENGWPTKS